MPALKKRSAGKNSARVARKPAGADVPWIEIPVFIHGINPNPRPATGRREYQQLLERVEKRLENRPDGFSKERIFITWGIPSPPFDYRDQYLADVERRIAANVRRDMGSRYAAFFGAYGLIRNFFFFGVADLIYYVSKDGETALRDHVFNEIAQTVDRLDRKHAGRFSLTLFGHSAGSVIAHDLLFHLFGGRRYTRSEEGEAFTGMERLRHMIAEGRLRLRRLYTFGSPISPLILRANSLIEKFRSDILLSPEHVGLRAEDGLSNPRWVNFWTRYDLASCPVDFLYSNSNGEIRDVEIRSSIAPASAHTGYWTSDEMAGYIAETF